MKQPPKLVKEDELLQHVPVSSRQLRELRFKRKIPYVALGHRTLIYDLDAVMAALEKLRVKAVV